MEHVLPRARTARASLLLPATALLLTAAASAQRFDNWVAGTVGANAGASTLATDPNSGAPTRIVALAGGGFDTEAWNGTAFVSLGLGNNPGTTQGEALAPFSVGGTSGLVHLGANGVTSIWTGGANWTTLGTLTPSPSAAALSAVAPEPGPNGFACLFGGTDAASQPVGDLWGFDGAQWQDLGASSVLQPAARVSGMLASNGTGGLVLFGGADSVSDRNDVWEFQAGQWRFAGKGPGVRVFGGALLDISRSALMVVGGLSSGAPANDAWILPVPLPAVPVAAADWTQITAALPFVTSTSGFVTAALDAVRNEPVAVDFLLVEPVVDQAASFLIRGASPTTNCVVPNLQITGAPGVLEPRVPAAGTASLGMGGFTGQAGAPMVWFAEFVTPGVGFATITPIPGSSCLNFLSPTALNLGATTTGAGGQYQFNLLIPANPALIGSVLDEQMFGLSVVGGVPPIIATEAARVVIGR